MMLAGNELNLNLQSRQVVMKREDSGDDVIMSDAFLSEADIGDEEDESTVQQRYSMS